MGKVSGKTHTKAQLDHWANLHNPNNKAYQADADNRLTIRNTMINIGGARYVKVHFRLR